MREWAGDKGTPSPSSGMGGEEARFFRFYFYVFTFIFYKDLTTISLSAELSKSAVFLRIELYKAELYPSLPPLSTSATERSGSMKQHLQLPGV